MHPKHIHGLLPAPQEAQIREGSAHYPMVSIVCLCIQKKVQCYTWFATALLLHNILFMVQPDIQRGFYAHHRTNLWWPPEAIYLCILSRTSHSSKLCDDPNLTKLKALYFIRFTSFQNKIRQTHDHLLISHTASHEAWPCLSPC